INYQNGQPVLKLLIDVNENKSGLPVSRIRAVAEDREGNIVVGTRFNGLFYLSLQQNKLLGITNFMKKDGLRSNTIWSLATDSRGNIWVGNELGLNKLSRHEDKLIVTDKSKQTQIYSTYQVTCDRDQSLWISNFPGIVKLNTSAVVPTRPFSVFITNVIAEGNPIQLKNEQKNNPFVYQQNTFIIEFSSNSF